MAQKKSWEPDWVTHPGEHLADILEARGGTPAMLAEMAGLSVCDVEAVMDAEKDVTEDMASKLEGATGLRGYVWLALQSHWNFALSDNAKV